MLDGNNSLPHEQGHSLDSVDTRLIEGITASIINKATKYRRWLLEELHAFVFIQPDHFKSKFHSTLEE